MCMIDDLESDGGGGKVENVCGQVTVFETERVIISPKHSLLTCTIWLMIVQISYLSRPCIRDGSETFRDDVCVVSELGQFAVGQTDCFG